MLRMSLLVCILSISVLAQGQNTKEKPKDSNSVATPAKIPRGIARKLGVLDYNSWFETIRIKGGGTPYDTKALLYGTGLSFEYATYFPDWGWSAQLGIIQGFAVAGDVSDATSYYARRVQLNILRGGGRYFKRINPRFDLGIASHLLITTKSYPPLNGLEVEAPNGLMIGGFIDSRWRLDEKWELLQSMGTYSRGPSLAWRLGTSYTF